MKTEWYGKYRAIVADIDDPERRGRIRVRCPKVLGDYLSAWCEPCIPYATDFAGDFYVPPVNEAIWVEFEEGDPNKPIWNGGWYRPNSTPLLPEHSQGDYRYISFKQSTLRIGYSEFAFEIKVGDQSRIIRIDEETWVGLYYISTKTEEELVDIEALRKNREYILVTFPEEVRDQFNNVNASLTYLDSQFNGFTTNIFNPFMTAVNTQLDTITTALENLTAKITEIDSNLRELQSEIDNAGIGDIRQQLDNIRGDISTIYSRLDDHRNSYNSTMSDLFQTNVDTGVIEPFTVVFFD